MAPPLTGMKLLRPEAQPDKWTQLRRGYPGTPNLFASERGEPVTDHSVRKLVKRAGKIAGIDFPLHPLDTAPRLRLQARQ